MVRPGYKRTQAGVIPEEWEEALLGEKAGIYRGGSPRPIQSYIAQSGSGVNWIKIGDVGAGEKYITKTAEKITLEGAARSRRVYAGDLILSNSMSFGRPYVLALDGCIHDGWLVIQDYHDTFCQDFLYYLLSSEFVFRQYAFMAAGSSVQNLNKGKVEALRVVIPSRPEQERIAGALSDADGLISALERLNSTINIQRIFLHFLSSQINYLRRIHNIFIYKRAIADYGCVVSEYLYRAGLRKLGACPFFFPAQKNRRAARKIGALLICATLCLMSFVMFLPFSIGTLDVLNGQHGPIVFILLVCFTITLIEIDLMQGFDEVLVCMGQILKQLSIKTQNLYPM